MKFSIITPSYNQGKWIGETLATVEGQAGAGGSPVMVEHIVMDGASGDSTIGLLDAWKNDHPATGPYFFDFVSEPDRGQTHAINKGMEKSSGEILSYLCSDDLLEPGTFENVARIFEKHPEVDVVYGDYFFLEGDSGWKRLKKARPFSVEELYRHNFISQPATFWRRSVYERFGGFDESLRYCMDHEYWLRIAKDVQWFYLEKPLAVMRLHGEAKTSAALGKAWEETGQMVQRYGLGPSFKARVWWMGHGGQWYYLLKRKVAEWWGKRRSKK